MLTEVLRGFELMNAGDAEAFAAQVRKVIAADATIEEPFGIKDREGALAGWLAWLRAFPNCEFKTRSVTESQSRFVIEMVVTGTHTGILVTPNGDVPATGRQVLITEATVIEHADGQVRTWHNYHDQASLAAQLGLMPSPV